jgi:hypothetical protein
LCLLAPARAAAALALGGVVLAAPAWAQSGSRYTWQASVTGSGVYDDNLYFEEDKESGTVMRVRPGLDGSYRFNPDLSIEASYSFDADYYPSQPGLTNMFAGQTAGLDALVRAGSRTNFSLGATYSSSAFGADLIGGSGLELGRQPGRAWGVSAGGSRRMSETGTLGLAYTRQDVTYQSLRATHSHQVSVNWSQQLGAYTDLSIGAGPRFMDGSTSTEASASVERRLRRGSVMLGYGRSRYAAPGQDVDADSLSATAQLDVSPSVQLTATPGFYRHRYDDGERGRSLRLVLGARWQVRPGLSGRATYQHVRQDGRPERATALAAAPWLARNMFVVSFTATVGRSPGTDVNAGRGPMDKGTRPGTTTRREQ